MAGQSPMQAALASAFGGGGAGAPPAAPPGGPMGNATGAPPPTGIGPMDVSMGKDPHATASTVISGLKDLAACYPMQKDQIDAMMAQVQQMATTPAGGKPGSAYTGGASPAGPTPPPPPPPAL